MSSNSNEDGIESSKDGFSRLQVCSSSETDLEGGSPGIMGVVSGTRRDFSPNSDGEVINVEVCSLST